MLKIGKDCPWERKLGSLILLAKILGRAGGREGSQTEKKGVFAETFFEMNGWKMILKGNVWACW